MTLKEITVRNAKPKDKKYRVFDGEGLYLEVWEFDTNNPKNYGYVRSGGLAGNGIDGGIYQKAEQDAEYVTFYVMVEDLQAYLDKAMSLGGTVLVPPTAIPGGGGRFAMFADPEGNRIGIYQ
jgi:predicted enzyme related to lactoylglutathione lyase